MHELSNDLPFLPEIMKAEKFEKLVADFHYKAEYFVHIRNLKQALKHRLVLNKVHKVIKFNQNTSLKPYVDMDTNLGKKLEKIEKYIFKLINNAVSGKTM